MTAERSETITARTRYCAVYGHPIHHSASPPMQNAGISGLGLDWRYLAFDVPPDHLEAAIRGAGAMRFIGLNLTVPHKLLAVNLVDLLDPSAESWGAVNTIRFETQSPSGEWVPLRDVDPDSIGTIRTQGFNTDADAIIRSVQDDLGVMVAGSSVLLLGAGGAGRVAALKLAAEGVRRLHLINRTTSKAEAVAAEIRSHYPAVEVSLDYPRDAIDLVLNATSLGLRTDDPLPFDRDRFSLRNATHVFDMIYRPAETPLLRMAREAGCPHANGLGMLLYQGVAALAIWSGMKPPVEDMRRALERNI